MKSVTQLNGTSLDSESSETSPDGEVSETSPLLSNRDHDIATHRSDADDHPVEVSVNQKGKLGFCEAMPVLVVVDSLIYFIGLLNSKSWICCYCCTGLIMLVLIFLSILAVICVFIVFEFKLPNDSDKQSTIDLYNQNDTIIVVEVNSKKTDQIYFKLVSESSQPLHVISLYQTPCNRLLTYNSSLDKSLVSKFSIDHTVHLVLLPTYLVNGSFIQVESYVLNVSANDIHITLYFFDGLDLFQTFETNLDESVYQAIIYTRGPGVQNTSTVVNYTVPSTGYYFAAVATDAYILAQFDITLHEELYSTSGYKPTCTVESDNECVLSDFPSEDEQECVLAHAAFVRDAEWAPAYMNVTIHSKGTAIVTFAVICGALTLCIFIFLILTAIFLYKFIHMRRKHARAKPYSSDDM